uniref:Wsv282-like protein n=1 Tax=Trachysalambria curvirostris majanivirus TaxID=2984281 RepID=A0A9C7EYY5_9VIRU|nr:MAG: wsv282-like protein [Trachysalambria curvirostris majanivirus]
MISIQNINKEEVDEMLISSSSLSSLDDNCSDNDEKIDEYHKDDYYNIDNYKSVLLLSEKKKINKRIIYNDKNKYDIKYKNIMISPKISRLKSLYNRLNIKDINLYNDISIMEKDKPNTILGIIAKPINDKVFKNRLSLNKKKLRITNPREVVDEILREERQTINDSEDFFNSSFRFSKEQVSCLSTFKNEIAIILHKYASLKRKQQLLGSFNTNSVNYLDEMIKKMVDIIMRFDKNNMPLDKYRNVVREALFLYHLIVSKMTGPKHLKRLRTPELHFDFCVIIALLSHNINVKEDLFKKCRMSNIIQFLSALDCSWYLQVINKLLSVFNSSSLICNKLSLSSIEHAQVDITLCLCHEFTKKSHTNIIVGIILYLFPKYLKRIRDSKLVRDNNTIRQLSKDIKEHLRVKNISQYTIQMSTYFLQGYIIDKQDTLKLFKRQHYDIKIVAIALLIYQRILQNYNTISYH